MKAMNSPMPAEMAIFIDAGIDREDLFPHTSDGEKQEEAAVDEDKPQCALPRDLHANANTKGKEGVDPHSRRKRERKIGQESHKQSGDCCAQRRRRDQRRLRHARILKNGRIYREDVGHGGKGRQAGDDLAPRGAAIFPKSKNALQHFEPSNTAVSA